MNKAKTAWITGASSGIGAALAVELAAHGWQVAASGRDRFSMPLIIDVDEATSRIRRGLGKKRFEITFPRRLAYLLKTMQRLPCAAYFPLIQRIAGRNL